MRGRAKVWTWTGALLVATAGLGAASVATGGAPGGATTWTLKWLPMVDGWTGASGFAINAKGDVAGWAAGEDGLQKPVAWMDGEPMDLELLAAPANVRGYAYGIDAKGATAGYCFGEVSHATYWDTRGRATDVHPTWPVEGVAYVNSFIFDLNKSGDAAGELDPDGGFLWSRAYVWTDHGRNGRLLPLLDGTTSSYGLGLNDRGDAVGHCFTAADWGARATFWPRHGGAVDIDALVAAAFPDTEFAWSWAMDVSNEGVVIGGAVEATDVGRVQPFTWSEKDGVRALARGDWNNVNPYRVLGKHVVGVLGGTDGIEPARAVLWEDGEFALLMEPPEGFEYVEFDGVMPSGDILGTAGPSNPWYDDWRPRPFMLLKNAKK